MPKIYKTINRLKPDEEFNYNLLDELHERVIDETTGHSIIVKKVHPILELNYIGKRTYTIDNRKDCLIVAQDLGNSTSIVLSKIQGNYLQICTFKALIGDEKDKIFEDTMNEQVIIDEEVEESKLRFKKKD